MAGTLRPSSGRRRFDGARAVMRKYLAMMGAASVLSMGAVGLSASAASAHTGSASADCSGVSVNLTSFQPTVPAQDAVTHTEYLFEHAPNGAYKTRWESDQDWNAQGNPSSTGWRLVEPLQTRTVTDSPATPAQANHVIVTINGSVVADTDFGTSYVKTFPFANTYQANTWSVSWTAYDDSRYSGSESGTSVACEAPTKPTPRTENRDVVGAPDCTALTVTTEHQSRTENVTWDADHWTTSWGDWVVDSTDTRDATLQECPTTEQPAAQVAESSWVDEAWDCGATSVTQTSTVTTTPYKLDVDGRTWVLDPAGSSSQTRTRTRPLTPDEVASCPVAHDPYSTTGHDDAVDCTAFAVAVTSWTTRWTWDAKADAYIGATSSSTSHRSPTAAECPAGQKPEPVVVQAAKADVDCSRGVQTVTTTTTTTDWVLDDAGTSWVQGASSVTTAVARHATTVQECTEVEGVKVTSPPTAPAVTPVVKGVKHSANAPVLAYTGADPRPYGIAGALLIVAGGGLVLAGRRRKIVG